MKIALFHDSLLPAPNYGGIERVVVTLAYGFKRLGHEVVVLCRPGSRLEGIECLPIPEGGNAMDPSDLLPADVDFIHSHQPLLVKPKKPFLVTIHGNGQPGEKYWANTCFLSESHAANHGGKYFVYNGIDCSRYPLVEQKEDYFVFLAKAKWRVKNLRTAVDLANDLKIRLEVMGGSGRSTKYVKFHGLIGENDGKLEILSRARALLYPTNWEEPFGLAVTEALACGTPVIASRNGAMREIVSPEVGFTCETYAEFVEAGRRIGEILPRACREKVVSHFSSERMVEGYLSLFEKVLEKGELDQSPHYAFRPETLRPLYKPTVLNRLRVGLMGKV